MFNRLGVLTSDALNRDGYIIAFQALEQMIAKNAVDGLPQLIDHDFHRPLGWIFPFGVLVEPKLSRVIGNFYYGESDQDYEAINPRIHHHWQQINIEACQPHIAEFQHLLGANFSNNGKFIEKGAIAYQLENITNTVFPDLFSRLDKSGLIYLNDILKDFDYVGHGIFKSKDSAFCIFCHQYFKRSLSLLNSYNTYFIDEFIKLKDQPNLTLRIAIDRNLIGLSKTMKGNLELDYWWGPKFNEDISNLPDGVTRYESNEDQKFFSNVVGTEFWWKSDGNEKTLEVEEIREKPSLGVNKDSYGCRYLHSIYDTSRQEFIHFDGAIRMYTDEQILVRWETNISKAGKNTDYTKLFRIDGKLELEDWKKLCILYYKGNPLLFEYFGAKEEYENLRNATKSTPATKFTQLIPYQVNNYDGVRILASYHKKANDYQTFERKISSSDSLGFRNGEILRTLEYDIIEVEKYIRRAGGSLTYPADIEFVKPFDFCTNYPIILHGANNTGQLLTTTLNAFRHIFEIQNRTLNKTVSFTLTWEMPEFEVRLSFFGKSSELMKWLKTHESIPVDYPTFKEWLKEQRQWICDTYEYRNNDCIGLVQEDGVFFIKRTGIEPAMIKFPDENDPNYFEINLDNNHELKELMDLKKIFPAHLGLIKKVTCSKTGENYLTSNTSKYLDEGVKMIVEKIDLLGFFWTDEQYH
jgi:hypothetical protein